MLPVSRLKEELHKQYSSEMKLLMLLASFDRPASIRELKSKALEAGLRIPKGWNVSSLLDRSKGRAIRTTNGWELQRAGREALRSVGVMVNDQSSTHEVAGELRNLLTKIKDPLLSDFLVEVITACELELFRCAIVMSWLAAMYQLQTVLIEKHLTDFNVEMKRTQPKWKPISRQDQLGKLRESEQLDRMCSIGIIDSGINKDLHECLTRRNNCGHPTKSKYGPSTVKHHIEILLQSVFVSIGSST